MGSRASVRALRCSVTWFLQGVLRSVELGLLWRRKKRLHWFKRRSLAPEPSFVELA